MPNQIEPDDHPHRVRVQRAEDKKVLLEKFQIWASALARYNAAAGAEQRRLKAAAEAAEKAYKEFANTLRRGS